MIAIIGAMQDEIDALIKRCSEIEKQEIYNIACYVGKMRSQDVVIALSGIGKVNASYTTAMINQEFLPTHVINIGSAGGLRESQTIGDIVVAKECCMHDFDIQNGFGTDNRFIAIPDEQLYQLTLQSAEELKFNTVRGLLVSGDQFITDPAQFALILERLPHAVAVDMESYAIGKVCKNMNIPFVVIRSISDIAVVEGNAVDFETFLPIASENSACICEAIIHRLI